ncbi:uncharacterized protein LOC135926995 [Gordionus sp. m RMFG-2023]|uniref:uncharacterized protein LOC135926995 n=1 Tax=Gordionus sp. m RMFG-2023 TaxID=3053472 RepID=UPI0031FCF797
MVKAPSKSGPSGIFVAEYMSPTNYGVGVISITIVLGWCLGDLYNLYANTLSLLLPYTDELTECETTEVASEFDYFKSLASKHSSIHNNNLEQQGYLTSLEKEFLRTPKPKLFEFRCHGVVGSGTFGMEFKVKLKNSTHLKNMVSVGIQTEINVLKAKKHPFLIGLFAFYPTYIIVRDITSGGDLRSLLKDMEDWIIHRDIKPESILLDRKGHVKLGNFAY